MSNIVNPYIVGSPVEGSEMFFGREDVFQFIRQTLRGQHCDNAIVLHGQQRTGKTSVLRQMRSRLDDARYLYIFMNLQSYALKDLDEFLWALADRIIRVLRREYRIDLPRPSRVEFMAEPRSFFENEFLNQVWSAIGERHLLLMLD
ncbi:MAG TPA: ATP-binding protein, partial [Ktedonobacteraceae bacterium]|nr:ATP-binding protein [Ktedonobacteraceae bacterium]